MSEKIFSSAIFHEWMIFNFFIIRESDDCFAYDSKLYENFLQLDTRLKEKNQIFKNYSKLWSDKLNFE